jgi:hypothetical protein
MSEDGSYTQIRQELADGRARIVTSMAERKAICRREWAKARVRLEDELRARCTELADRHGLSLDDPRLAPIVAADAECLAIGNRTIQIRQIHNVLRSDTQFALVIREPGKIAWCNTDDLAH